MVGRLAELMVSHPGFANLLMIVGFLLFAVFLFFFGFRRVPYFWPGRIGSVLTLCYKSGCGLLILFCLFGGVRCGVLEGLARQKYSMNPLLIGVLAFSWLLIIVPCIMRDANKKREKRRLMSSKRIEVS